MAMKWHEADAASCGEVPRMAAEPPDYLFPTRAASIWPSRSPCYSSTTRGHILSHRYSISDLRTTYASPVRTNAHDNDALSQAQLSSNPPPAHRTNDPASFGQVPGEY